MSSTPTFKSDLRRLAQKTADKVLPVLRFGSAVVDKIPTRTDSPLQLGAKALALADAALRAYDENRSPLARILSPYDVKEFTSSIFVKMFFSTDMYSKFEVSRRALDPYTNLVETHSPEGERLFFLERTYGQTRMEPTFFANRNVSLKRLVESLWGHYPQGIYLAMSEDPYEREITVCQIPCVTESLLSRAARENLAGLVARQRQYFIDGTHRCYLFLGPPGTGKTTLSILFGGAFGGRTLKLDASSLSEISVKELELILENFSPSVLLIDDIDRADVATASPRILFLMEQLKATHPKTPILLTANDAKKLDGALLRCGRIDVAIEFLAPEEDELTQMVENLLRQYQVSTEHTAAVVAAICNDHLSHAYIHDLCRRLRHETLDEVVESVRFLNDLAKRNAAHANANVPGSTPERDADQPTR